MCSVRLQDGTRTKKISHFLYRPLDEESGLYIIQWRARQNLPLFSIALGALRLANIRSIDTLTYWQTLEDPSSALDEVPWSHSKGNRLRNTSYWTLDSCGQTTSSIR